AGRRGKRGVSTLDTMVPFAGEDVPLDTAAGTRSCAVAGTLVPAPRTPPAGSARPDPTPVVSVAERHADLDALAGDWDDLWARSRSATPFTTHSWTSAWARAYV